MKSSKVSDNIDNSDGTTKGRNNPNSSQNEIPIRLFNMHITHAEITAPRTEENRFCFMEKYFFPDGSGSITPNHCPTSSSEIAFRTQETPHRDKSNETKTSDNYNLIQEIMDREHGLSGNVRRSLSNPSGFQYRFCGSRHVAEKLELLHSIHHGHICSAYNSLNFNRAGNLLCSNSNQNEQATVKVYDWGLNKLRFSFKTGHEIITDLKFIEINSSTSIVTANAYGQIHIATIPPSGGEILAELIYKSNSSFCKLALCPHNPFVLISAARDGNIAIFDLRVSSAVVCEKNVMEIGFYSISHHPFDLEICMSCNDNYVRVYDERNLSQTVYDMCPQEFIDEDFEYSTSTSVYNSTGSEILASYGCEDIFLFHHKAYIPGSFAHRYYGHFPEKSNLRLRHQNNAKFFGLNSEYVISNSEFGSLCIWDKSTEEIIDITGDMIDEYCFEPHPFIPIVASRGHDENIRIWAPMKTNVRRRHTTVHNIPYSNQRCRVHPKPSYSYITKKSKIVPYHFYNPRR